MQIHMSLIHSAQNQCNYSTSHCEPKEYPQSLCGQNLVQELLNPSSRDHRLMKPTAKAATAEQENGIEKQNRSMQKILVCKGILCQLLV